MAADHNAKSDDLVDLNIGGERLVTVPRSTLTQFENSMLAAMFSGRHQLATDATGRVFLNRDPRYFGHVLDYLRNGGKLPSNLPTDERELRRVRDEFDYFILKRAFTTSLAAEIGRGAYEEVTLQPSLMAEQLCNGELPLQKLVMSERYLVAAYANSGKLSTVEVWDLDTHRPFLLTLTQGEQEVDSMAVHDDILAFSKGDEVCVYRVAAAPGECMATLGGGQMLTDEHSYRSVAVSATCVAAATDMRVRVWDREGWECLRTLNSHWMYVRDVGLSGDTLAYVNHEGSICACNVRTGAVLHQWAPEEGLPRFYGLRLSGDTLTCCASRAPKGMLDFVVWIYRLGADDLVRRIVLPVSTLRWVSTHDTFLWFNEFDYHLYDVQTGETSCVWLPNLNHAAAYTRHIARLCFTEDPADTVTPVVIVTQHESAF